MFTTNDGDFPQYRQRALGVPDLDVSQEGIFEALSNLNTKTSCGPDNTPNILPKIYAEWCSKFLQIIYTRVFEHGILPDQWKMANVVPIYKAGDKQQVSNYKPFLLLCSCSKELENFLFKHLMTHFEASNFIPDQQHSFRRGFSKVTQPLYTVNEFAKALDREGQIDIIFLDFAKSFERQLHQKLQIKVKAILNNEWFVRWLDSYLTNNLVQTASSNTRVTDTYKLRY